jgi:predicted phage tail protein
MKEGFYAKGDVQMDKVRVLRIIEYVGDRKWVEETLQRGGIPANGSKKFGESNIIKSALIDQFPEVIEVNKDSDYLDDTEQEMTEEQNKYIDDVSKWLDSHQELLELNKTNGGTNEYTD